MTEWTSFLLDLPARETCGLLKLIKLRLRSTGHAIAQPDNRAPSVVIRLNVVLNAVIDVLGLRQCGRILVLDIGKGDESSCYDQLFHGRWEALINLAVQVALADVLFSFRMYISKSRLGGYRLREVR